MLDIYAHSIYRASGFKVPSAITIASTAPSRPSILATTLAAAFRGAGRLFQATA